MAADSELRARYERDVSVVFGTPDSVLRPRDRLDVVRAVKDSSQQHISVLGVGKQTSTTGASVAVGGGLLIDLSTLDQAPEIDIERGLIVAHPGTSIAALQQLAHQHGFDMPVDPTSAADCTVGGAVATNASGASSYRHGSIARWLQAVSFIDGVGTQYDLRRPSMPKNAMGPVALQNPLHWMAGSEGTLGLITRVTLRLRQRPGAVLGVLVGFATRELLLLATQTLAHNAAWQRHQTSHIRAIEWLGAACCGLITGSSVKFADPKGQGGWLFVAVEGEQDDAEAHLQQLVDAMAPFGVTPDAAHALLTPAQLRDWAQARHVVPTTLNARGRAHHLAHGGGKLSTDWSAPLNHMGTLLERIEKRLADIGPHELFMYGHIGDGHPHLNVLCPDAASRAHAMTLLQAQLADVVRVGGVPVSEHGVGKLKRDWVAPYMPPGALAAWRGLKTRFDPAGILAPGNLHAIGPA
ncbi:MAG: FAD-binding oxidoreductase [Myxococcales bacterium]|nr:FAD-binding oxidoreductase [Myxococcales bacterium]